MQQRLASHPALLEAMRSATNLLVRVFIIFGGFSESFLFSGLPRYLEGHGSVLWPCERADQQRAPGAAVSGQPDLALNQYYRFCSCDAHHLSSADIKRLQMQGGDVAAQACAALLRVLSFLVRNVHLGFVALANAELNADPCVFSADSISSGDGLLRRAREYRSSRGGPAGCGGETRLHADRGTYFSLLLIPFLFGLLLILIDLSL
jgi:hypothetical protein